MWTTKEAEQDELLRHGLNPGLHAEVRAEGPLPEQKAPQENRFRFGVDALSAEQMRGEQPLVEAAAPIVSHWSEGPDPAQQAPEIGGANGPGATLVGEGGHGQGTPPGSRATHSFLLLSPAQGATSLLTLSDQGAGQTNGQYGPYHFEQGPVSPLRLDGILPSSFSVGAQPGLLGLDSATEIGEGGHAQSAPPPPGGLPTPPASEGPPPLPHHGNAETKRNAHEAEPPPVHTASADNDVRLGATETATRGMGGDKKAKLKAKKRTEAHKKKKERQKEKARKEREKEREQKEKEKEQARKEKEQQRDKEQAQRERNRQQARKQQERTPGLAQIPEPEEVPEPVQPAELEQGLGEEHELTTEADQAPSLRGEMEEETGTEAELTAAEGQEEKEKEKEKEEQTTQAEASHQEQTALADEEQPERQPNEPIDQDAELSLASDQEMRQEQAAASEDKARARQEACQGGTGPAATVSTEGQGAEGAIPSAVQGQAGQETTVGQNTLSQPKEDKKAEAERETEAPGKTLDKSAEQASSAQQVREHQDVSPKEAEQASPPETRLPAIQGGGDPDRLARDLQGGEADRYGVPPPLENAPPPPPPREQADSEGLDSLVGKIPQASPPPPLPDRRSMEGRSEQGMQMPAIPILPPEIQKEDERRTSGGGQNELPPALQDSGAAQELAADEAQAKQGPPIKTEAQLQAEAQQVGAAAKAKVTEAEKKLAAQAEQEAHQKKQQAEQERDAQKRAEEQKGEQKKQAEEQKGKQREQQAEQEGEQKKLQAKQEGEQKKLQAEQEGEQKKLQAEQEREQKIQQQRQREKQEIAAKEAEGKAEQARIEAEGRAEEARIRAEGEQQKAQEQAKGEQQKAQEQAKGEQQKAQARAEGRQRAQREREIGEQRAREREAQGRQEAEARKAQGRAEQQRLEAQAEREWQNRNLLERIGDAISSAWNSLMNAARAAWDAAVSAANAIVNAALAAARAIREAAARAAEAALQLAEKVVGDIAQRVAQAIQQIAQQVAQAIQQIAQQVAQAIQQIAQRVAQAIQAAVQRIRDAIQAIVRAVAQAIQQIVDACRRAIQAAVNWVRDKVQAIASWVKEKIQAAVNWVKDRVKAIWDAVKAAVKAIVEAVAAAVTAIYNVFKEKVAAIGKWLSEQWDKFSKWAQEAFVKFWTGPWRDVLIGVSVALLCAALTVAFPGGGLLLAVAISAAATGAMRMGGEIAARRCAVAIKNDPDRAARFEREMSTPGPDGKPVVNEWYQGVKKDESWGETFKHGAIEGARGAVEGAISGLTGGASGAIGGRLATSAGRMIAKEGAKTLGKRVAVHATEFAIRTGVDTALNVAGNVTTGYANYLLDVYTADPPLTEEQRQRKYQERVGSQLTLSAIGAQAVGSSMQGLFMHGHRPATATSPEVPGLQDRLLNRIVGAAPEADSAALSMRQLVTREMIGSQINGLQGGITGGLTAMAQGGNFMDGFGPGYLSGVSSHWGNVMGNKLGTRFQERRRQYQEQAARQAQAEAPAQHPTDADHSARQPQAEVPTSTSVESVARSNEEQTHQLERRLAELETRRGAVDGSEGDTPLAGVRRSTPAADDTQTQDTKEVGGPRSRGSEGDQSEPQRRLTETQPEENKPKETLHQQVKDLDQLYQHAAVAQEHLSQATRDIAAAVGGEPLIPPTLKSRERAQEKINADYGGDASRITDLARSSIVCQTPEQVYQALELLRGRFNILREKDRFKEPASGYRDILLNVEMPNGHIVEVQLHLKSILEVKNGEGHHLYEQIRSIEAKAKTEQRALTPEEAQTVAQLKERMQRLYDEAFASSTKPKT
ncbi:MAG: hypothetical protein NZ890_00590, partial [Myxococcota bacterium]|nr:hypothetical protein [Myxococcota bacterium]